MHGAAVDTTGLGGVWFDPVWRVEVRLTPLERRLLDTWTVRRLAFVAHAGAASITTTQNYSRLEHSLGVLALTAHFAPDDTLARTTALLHDVGHLPFSHSLEGLGGPEHHGLGRTAVRALARTVPGLDAEAVIAVDDGRVPSVLTPRAGGLKLDHLDSFLRSGQAHGRTTRPPHEVLRDLRVVDGTVDTDAATARELADLAVAEALAQRSAANLVPVTVLRSLVGRLLDAGDLDPRTVAACTDDELWALLRASPATADDAELLRRYPRAWRMTAPGARPDGGAAGPLRPLRHTVRRSYLTAPTVQGRPTTDPRFADLEAALPLPVVVVRDEHDTPLDRAS